MKIEILQKSHDKTTFDCGQADLNRFIKQFALQHHKTGTSKTYVVLDRENAVIGFYCLSSQSIAFEYVDSHLTKKLPRYPISSIVIGRFAVAKNTQGQGIGKKLLAHALRQISITSQLIGITFVVVHAKDEKAADFYKSLGFKSSNDYPLTLILPVNDIPSD